MLKQHTSEDKQTNEQRRETYTWLYIHLRMYVYKYKIWKDGILNHWETLLDNWLSIH